MEKVKNIYKKIDDALALVDKVYIAVFTLLIALLILASIIIRAFGLQSFSWLDELSRFMLVTTTLCGSSLAVRTNEHMVMDSVYSMFSEKIGDILRAIVNWICGLGFIYLSYYAFEWMRKLFKMHKMTSTLGIPIWPVWVIVSFCILTFGIRHFVNGFVWLEHSKTASTERVKKDEGGNE